jgi:hypothetical protein
LQQQGFVMKTLSVIAVGLGIVLFLASLAWAFLFPATRSWTEEKSQHMSDLVDKAHILGGQLEGAKRRPNMHSGRSAAEIEAEYNQTKTELAELKQEFEGKRDAPKKAASYLCWSGVAFIVAGGFIVMANRS